MNYKIELQILNIKINEHTYILDIKFLDYNFELRRI